jgi:hypothetical protein
MRVILHKKPERVNPAAIYLDHFVERPSLTKLDIPHIHSICLDVRWMEDGDTHLLKNPSSFLSGSEGGMANGEWLKKGN